MHARERLSAMVSSVGSAARRKSLWFRLTAGALVTSLALLVLLNTVLNLGVARPLLSRLISVDPQSFDLDYRRAWSFWPSLVYVRNVKLRGNDANLQWQIEVDAARVSIDLLALLHREFHATKVRAEGIGLRLRQKLDVVAATRDRIAPLPPILGFDGPPLRNGRPPADELSNIPYDLWSVRIENVAGLVRQIWFDEVHFEGKVRVTGAFFLQPKRQLWVGPAHAAILSGTITLGDERLLQSVSGAADCHIPPFDPSAPVGMEFFRYISGNARLDANISSARAFDYYPRIRGIPLQFDGGQGVLHVDGTLRSGIIRPLNLALTMGELTAETGKWLAVGTLEVSARTNAQGPSAWSARIGSVELRRAGANVVAIDGKPLQLDAQVDEIDLSRAAPDLEIHGDLPLARVPNLRFINEFVSSPNGLHVDGGKASFSAQLIASTGTNSIKGVASVDADAVAGRYGALQVAGRVNANAHVAKLLLDSGAFEVSKAVIDAREVTLRDSDVVVGNWWGSVESHDAKLRPSQAVPFEVNWTAKLENAVPLLAFSKHTPALPGWIVRFLSGGEVNGTGRLRAGKAFVELSKMKAQTGLLNVEGSFRKRGNAKVGAFRVSAGPLSVGIELTNDEMKLIFIGRPVVPALIAPAD